MKTECDRLERPVLAGYEKESGITYLYQPRCKQWDCRYCASVNKSQWALKIGFGVGMYRSAGLKDWQFMTITSHEKLRTREATLAVWPRAWSKLSQRMRRVSTQMKYSLAPELHQDGRLHVHLCINTPVKKRWLKDNARQCGLGYMVDIQELVNEITAAFYMTKYLTKSLDVTSWPPKFRRIRTSQKWPILPPDKDFDQKDLQWRIERHEYPVEGLPYLVMKLEEVTGRRYEIL